MNNSNQLVQKSNVWMGVSIETQRYSFRLDHLRDVPAAIRKAGSKKAPGELIHLDKCRGLSK